LNSNYFIEIQGLTVSFNTPQGEIRAVDGVSLGVRKGETLALVGESGSGKTTLGLALLKMVPPPGRITQGSIKVDNIDILELRGEALRRYRWKKVAMVFQSAMNALDPVKTVGSQIAETIVQHENVDKKQAKARVLKLLETVGLAPEVAESYPHQLSGGMKQRVVIALAICLNPEVLIADEPTTALDVVVQAEIMRVLKELKERLNLTIILITHDVSIIGSVSDRVAIMYAGRLVEEGPTSSVITEPSHPYTQALLASLIEPRRDGQVVVGIQGSPPNPLALPSGCKFNPRCLYAFERCRNGEPTLIELGRDRRVACWLRC